MSNKLFLCAKPDYFVWFRGGFFFATETESLSLKKIPQSSIGFFETTQEVKENLLSLLQINWHSARVSFDSSAENAMQQHITNIYSEC
jgi:hypothetical protein